MGLNIYVYKKTGDKFNDKYDSVIEKLNDRFLSLVYQRELLKILNEFDYDRLPATKYPEYDCEFYIRPKIDKSDLSIIKHKLKISCGNNYRIFMVLIKKLLEDDVWLFYSI